MQQVVEGLRSRKAVQSSSEREEIDRASSLWCPICLESTGEPSEKVLECNDCHLRVHKGCGILHTETATSKWTCDPCRAKDSSAHCIFCPVKKGLLKPTKVAGGSSTRWAHPLCIKLLDDCGRADSNGGSKSSVDSASARKCEICQSPEECRVKCSEPSCDREFHVGCMLLQQDVALEKFKVRRQGIGFRAGLADTPTRTLFCDVHAKVDAEEALPVHGACANCGNMEPPSRPDVVDKDTIVCQNRVGRCDKWFHAACWEESSGQDADEGGRHKLCKDCNKLTAKFTPEMLAGEAVPQCRICSSQFSSLHALDVHISSNPLCNAGARSKEIGSGQGETLALGEEGGEEEQASNEKGTPEADGDATESDKSVPESGTRTKAKPKLAGLAKNAESGNTSKGTRSSSSATSHLKRKQPEHTAQNGNADRAVRPKEGRDQLREHAAACSLLDLGDAMNVDSPAASSQGLAHAFGVEPQATPHRPAALDATNFPHPDKQSQGLGALKWCAGGAGGGGRWIVDGTAASDSPSDKKGPQQPAQNGRSSKEQTLIGDGIMISGGRVLMQNANPDVNNVALCVFCQRTFISSHALDVHLSRNQICRFENEMAKAKKKNNPGGMQHPVKQYMERRPHTALRGGFAGMASHGESCRDIMAALMRKPDAAKFKLTAVGHDDPYMSLASISKKATATLYKNANDMRDDLLAIWSTTLRNYGPQSSHYAVAKQLSIEFDQLFEAATDKVRGMGGIADLNFFRHGPAWVGQEVKVYVPADHARLMGVIDEHDEVDSTTHLYHIQYDDGCHQWTTLPNPKVELVGWVPDEEFKNPLATYVANASNIPALKVLPSSKQVAIVGPVAPDVVARGPTDRVPVGKEASSASKDPGGRPESLLSIQCPSFKDGQEVEMLQRGKGKYLSGKVVSLVGHGNLDIRGQDGELYKGVPDDFVRAPEGCISHLDIALLIQELKKKPQYDFFDHPVDDNFVANYYHPNPAARQRGITAWNTQSMCFAWMERKAAKKQYPNVSEVEYDFNLIISNAIIFNPQQHTVNREARKLFQAAKTVFSKWARKPGCYSCKTCTKADTFREPIVICDYCCRGIHQHCFLQAGRKSFWLWSQEVSHPLRGDSCFFCSESCLKHFQSVADSFKLPSVTAGGAQEGPSKRACIDSDGLPLKDAFPTGPGMPMTTPSRPLGQSRQNTQLASPSKIGGFTMKVLPQAAAHSAQLPLSVKARSATGSPQVNLGAAGQPAAEKMSVPSKEMPQAKSQAEIRDMKNSLMAIRAARETEKACQQRYQSAQHQLQEALSTQNVNAALFEEAQRRCQQYEKAIMAGSGSKERFLSQSGAGASGAQQQSNIKLRHLRETGATLAQLFGAWSVEHKLLIRCQDTQKALQDALQGTDDPPDELLEAAEQACEEYDRSMSMTATLRDKYLSFRGEI